MSTSLTRRNVLEVAASAVASVLMTPTARALVQRKSSWKPVPIGTQAWCVRKQLATEIPGTLAALAKLGYEAVELENAFGKSGKEWHTHLRDAGLKVCGFHHRFDELQGDKLQAAIEFNQAIGNRNLIIRSLSKEVYTNADLLKKTSDTVNEIAARSRPHTLRVGYHNHTTDFNRLGGEYLVEPLRRSDDEGCRAAIRHGERVGARGGERHGSDPPKRGADDLDARQTVLEEEPRRVSGR